MHMPVLKIALLAGVALSPLPALAQQIDPDWSPVEDNYASSDEAPDDAAPVSKKRGKKRAEPRVEVVPYIEVQQVLVADLKNGGDVLTYSTVAAGVDASIATRRAEGQVSVRYERLIGYDNGVDDQDIVTGLARGSLAVTRNLSLEAGAVAARSRVDGRGAAPVNLVGNPDNITQVYSVYGGPTFTTQAGDLSINAAYRAGYTKVETKDSVVLPAGQQRFDQFDDSVSQLATASVGMQPGPLPIGWAVSGSWQREDAGQLDGRFDGKYVRGDVTVPVSPTLALVGGIGYEDIEISERDALRDAGGVPIVGTDGRLVKDPNSPRLIAYQTDGLIWDAGVLWRPSPRTSVEARYGRRYGSDIYIGSLSYRPGRDWAVNVSVYDTVTGFGSLLNDNLAALPTQFRTTRNPLSGDIGGCAFGQSGGLCLNDALQNASSAAFRQRGITASFSGTTGGWDTGVALGYNRRKAIASSLGAQTVVNGVTDEFFFAAAYLGTNIDQRTRFESNIYASYFDSGFASANDVLQTGANAALYRQIIRGLSAKAAVGLDSYRQEDFDSELTASALLGLRYSF
ncbi:hypothetical protein [Sphingorhabdus lacus]|uniref:hypothetical protein n=1 Tax=Sphingorhabdus lacus TaxID=392610 RepID=UPI003593EDD8